MANVRLAPKGYRFKLLSTASAFLLKYLKKKKYREEFATKFDQLLLIFQRDSS
jgi:hypothetical protein